jgi:mono/diheme cytochrome c family protein
LNDEYFAGNMFGIPCVVCHGVTAQGVVGPPNSFRLLTGPGSLEYYQNWRDTTAEATLVFGPEIAGWMARLGGVLATTATAARSNAQLVADIGTRAEGWAVRKGVTGTAQQTGIAKHQYARDLLNRYQDIFGSRGLRAEISVINGNEVLYGTRGSVRLDVLEGSVRNPSMIYDYKFGTSGLSTGRINQIRRLGGYPGTPIIEVRP